MRPRCATRSAHSMAFHCTVRLSSEASPDSSTRGARPPLPGAPLVPPPPLSRFLRPFSLHLLSADTGGGGGRGAGRSASSARDAQIRTPTLRGPARARPHGGPNSARRAAATCGDEATRARTRRAPRTRADRPTPRMRSNGRNTVESMLPMKFCATRRVLRAAALPPPGSATLVGLRRRRDRDARARRGSPPAAAGAGPGAAHRQRFAAAPSRSQVLRADDCVFFFRASGIAGRPVFVRGRVPLASDENSNRKTPSRRSAARGRAPLLRSLLPLASWS